MVDDKVFVANVSCSDGSKEHTMTYMGSDQQQVWQGDADTKAVKQWFCPSCGLNKYSTA